MIQLDGATLHFTNQPIQLFKQQRDRQVIPGNADVNWPSRAFDLTAINFFLI